MAKKNKAEVLPFADDHWQAHNDAETLARAAEIKADKKRMEKASQAAKKMVAEAAARAKAMKQIAKVKPDAPKKRK